MFKTLVQDDINAVFQIPNPRNIVKLIKNDVVSACSVVNQFTINTLGERTEKNRLIHYQSFDFSDEKSANHSMVPDQLHGLRHGDCLMNALRYAQASRLSFPKKRTLASKIDLNSACRRAHLTVVLDEMAIAIVGTFALVSLCLPLVGTHYV